MIVIDPDKIRVIGSNDLLQLERIKYEILLRVFK